jgi:hypothetical protein
MVKSGQRRAETQCVRRGAADIRAGFGRIDSPNVLVVSGLKIGLPAG